MDTISPAQREAMKAAVRDETNHLQREEMRQFSKAATSGQGNRKQRRQMQAELKKMMRKR